MAFRASFEIRVRECTDGIGAVVVSCRVVSLVDCRSIAPRPFILLGAPVPLVTPPTKGFEPDVFSKRRETHGGPSEIHAHRIALHCIAVRRPRRSAMGRSIAAWMHGTDGCDAIRYSLGTRNDARHKRAPERWCAAGTRNGDGGRSTIPWNAVSGGRRRRVSCVSRRGASSVVGGVVWRLPIESKHDPSIQYGATRHDTTRHASREPQRPPCPRQGSGDTDRTEPNGWVPTGFEFPSNLAFERHAGTSFRARTEANRRPTEDTGSIHGVRKTHPTNRRGTPPSATMFACEPRPSLGRPSWPGSIPRRCDSMRCEARGLPSCAVGGTKRNETNPGGGGGSLGGGPVPCGKEPPNGRDAPPLHRHPVSSCRSIGRTTRGAGVGFGRSFAWNTPRTPATTRWKPPTPSRGTPGRAIPSLATPMGAVPNPKPTPRASSRGRWSATRTAPHRGTLRHGGERTAPAVPFLSPHHHGRSRPHPATLSPTVVRDPGQRGDGGNRRTVVGVCGCHWVR